MPAEEKENIENKIEEVDTFLPEKRNETKGKTRRKKSLNLLIGVTITFMVCVFDATSIACLQLMDKLPPDIQINALNFAFGFICIIPYFMIKRKLPIFNRNKIFWIIAICVVFLVDCLTLYNQEASFLPLGSIGSIGYAFNIIFSVILSKIFLTEVMSLHKGVALVVTLLGLVLTVLAHVPSLGISFSECASLDQNGHQENYSLSLAGQASEDQSLLTNLNATLNVTYSTNSQEIQGGSIMSLVSTADCNSGPKHQKSVWSEVLSMFLLATSCFCSALETVILSGSRLKHESPPTLAFWIFLSGSIVLFPATFIFENPTFPETWTDRTYLLTYCICAAGLTYCYIIAAQLLMPMFLTIIESFGVPLMFVVQMLFLTQIAKPNNIWLQMAGVLLVFCATIALPVIEYMSVKKEEKLKNRDIQVETKV